jgi:hypothetical protein
MNKVPVQNVIPGLIEPFPLLVLIVTCLVGDQQPFAFLTNASQGNDCCGCGTWADAAVVKRLQAKESNTRTIVVASELALNKAFHHGSQRNHTASNGIVFTV